MPDLFEPRKNLKPYEYPNMKGYIHAIRTSFWVHQEFEFTPDVQDFKVNCTPTERSIIKRTMLAISQIEVSVKRFWADIYNHIPKPEVDAVGVTFAECHAEGTEVLTPNGWVEFDSIGVGDRVIQFHHEDSTFSITTVQHKTEQSYQGEMHHWYKTSAEGVVTPNHRMLYWDYKDRFTERSASKLGHADSNKKLPEAAKLKGEVDTLSDMDRLRIALQADGHRRNYRNSSGEKCLRNGNGAGAEYDLGLTKERKVNRLEDILSRLDVEYSVRTYPSRPEQRRYTIRVDDDHSYKTFDWVSLEGKSYKWCEEFVQELAEWDGTHLPDKKDCKIKYATTSKKCADVVQAVGMGAGYRCHINTYEDTRKDSHKSQYTVSFTKNRERVSFGSHAGLKKETVEQYDGKVYCITVNSGAIVTRYNDKPLISGNSEVRHSDAYSHLLDLLGLVEEFEDITDVPAIQDRIAYLDKYLQRDTDDPKSYVRSVLLFSLFIEFVSLFSQFLIMLSFDKYDKRFKGIANAVEATSKEEQIHGMFGAEIINIVQEERPEWFTEEFIQEIRNAALKAFDAEQKVLDWIFAEGHLEFLPREVIDEFLKDKFNEGMDLIGQKPLFQTEDDLVAETQWFREEMIMTKGNDFFSKRGTAYSKFERTVTEDDLFN